MVEKRTEGNNFGINQKIYEPNQIEGALKTCRFLRKDFILATDEFPNSIILVITYLYIPSFTFECIITKKGKNFYVEYTSGTITDVVMKNDISSL